MAGATLAAPVVARADVVYSGLININLPSTTDGVYINFVTGVTGTTPGAVPGWDLNPWGTTALNIWANNPASLLSGVVVNFPGGTSSNLVDNCPCQTIINDAWTFGRTSAVETIGATAFLLNSGQNYIGFRFLNEATGQYNYGWARISLSAGYGTQPRTLLEYAYENNGGPIAVGLLSCVPEPSTTALLCVLAAGALGVRLWRRGQGNSSR